MSWMERVKFDERGLVPVVAQEADTGEVLMLAYANRDALARTAATGAAHYYSRSRGELWQKGSTSGNVQSVVDIRLDCDGDAVLYRVQQSGPACHTGARSCFAKKLQGSAWDVASDARHVLTRIEQVVRERDEQRPAGAYSTYLFERGIDKILKKVGEETTEVVIAAKNDDAAELRSEIADLLFHLVVLLRDRRLPLSEVWNELDTRFSGPEKRPHPE